MSAFEVNFDGLVGPTHNYAGLSHGNLASMEHRGAVSNPRAAALQGLAKMKALADLGLKQAVLPPHDRPDIGALRRLGFRGAERAILAEAQRIAPALLAACSSASNMWVANAATVAPSCDTSDGRVHFTPANLGAKFHRSIEASQTARTLRAIFRDRRRFMVHEPIPGGAAMGDEGAVNHTRLAPGPGAAGLHFFVYGYDAAHRIAARAFAPRQALEASQAVARLHGLNPKHTVFAQQARTAIAAGVFHNDVISVGHDNAVFHHEQAFENTAAVIACLGRAYSSIHAGRELVSIRVPTRRVSLRDAVRSYLFNSQLVTVTPGRMALIAPSDCREFPRVLAFLVDLLARGDTPIREVHYLDLKESMRNGGGPACLRLRVELTEAEISALPPGVFLDDRNYRRLVAWVKKHYRERLTFQDLGDPKLLEESRRALDELTRLLGLGSIYPFQ